MELRFIPAFQQLGKELFPPTNKPAIFMAKSLASDYEKTMATALEKMYRSTSPAELTGIANQFSRITQAEEDQWLPSYYAAFSYVRATYFSEKWKPKKYINTSTKHRMN